MATTVMTPVATGRPMPNVEGVDHRFIHAGNIRIHIAETGEGEPVVMLHGWPQHWYEWRHQIPELAKHYRVICPDLRGFGWSDAPPDGYEKENLAQDIVNLLDALELQSVRLVGHDWGGWIGFLLCLKHPERFSRYLALNIPPPWGKTDLRTVAASLRFWYQWLIASPGLGEWLIRTRPGFVRTMLRFGTGKQAFSEDELKVFTDALQEPQRAKATVQLYRTFVTREFPAVAAGRFKQYRLKTPTRLLFGVEDFAISLAFLRGYEPFVDDFELELVPHTGHFIAEERPELVTKRALELFAD